MSKLGVIIKPAQSQFDAFTALGFELEESTDTTLAAWHRNGVRFHLPAVMAIKELGAAVDLLVEHAFLNGVRHQQTENRKLLSQLTGLNFTARAHG